MRVVLLAKQAGDSLEGVDRVGELNLCRVVHEQVYVIVLHAAEGGRDVAVAVLAVDAVMGFDTHMITGAVPALASGRGF
ncbi:hypothetical protein [Streptomyces barringtoniae]|uniref:hypothetical protein n=1 Tax=Streptomyces barringtoniae TaxID=2892029 RepID=UPI001E387EF8|nr:hypothetical protein [Streptomyces barringtoniae]MCC5478262.1 hypothetical protein [Streptomyces barringtoniae]